MSNTFSLGWLYRPASILISNGGSATLINTSVYNMYFVNYLVKVYPLGTLFPGNHLQGIYIGLGPGAYAETLNYKSYRQGIALFLNVGCQFNLSPRLSLSFEVEVIWTTDFNNAATWNSHGNYLFDAANTFKVGWNFQGNSHRRLK